MWIRLIIVIDQIRDLIYATTGFTFPTVKLVQVSVSLITELSFKFDSVLKNILHSEKQTIMSIKIL